MLARKVEQVERLIDVGRRSTFGGRRRFLKAWALWLHVGLFDG
jgi:hypothetical protein